MYGCKPIEGSNPSLSATQSSSGRAGAWFLPMMPAEPLFLRVCGPCASGDQIAETTWSRENGVDLAIVSRRRSGGLLRRFAWPPRKRFLAASCLSGCRVTKPMEQRHADHMPPIWRCRLPGAPTPTGSWNGADLAIVSPRLFRWSTLRMLNVASQPYSAITQTTGHRRGSSLPFTRTSWPVSSR